MNQTHTLLFDSSAPVLIPGCRLKEYFGKPFAFRHSGTRDHSRWYGRIVGQPKSKVTKHNWKVLSMCTCVRCLKWI